MTLFLQRLSLIILFFNIQTANCQPQSAKETQSVTGILGALDSEVALLKENLQEPKEVTIQGIQFFEGILKGKPVVVARSGVGKVNAAIITTLLLQHYHPKRLLFTGIAGGIGADLLPGDVVIGTAAGYHDYGRKLPDSMVLWQTSNPIDRSTNPLDFPCDSQLVAIAKNASQSLSLVPIANRIPIITTGLILTGDVFVSDPALVKQMQKRMYAAAVEMEGAAVAQTCYQQHVPFLIIRSLSDNANQAAAIDFKLNEKAAAQNSASLVMAILQALPDAENAVPH